MLPRRHLGAAGSQEQIHRNIIASQPVANDLLSQRHGQFYDEWESILEKRRQVIIRGNLDAYVRFARESTEYYRDRLIQ